MSICFELQPLEHRPPFLSRVISLSVCVSVCPDTQDSVSVCPVLDPKCPEWRQNHENWQEEAHARVTHYYTSRSKGQRIARRGGAAAGPHRLCVLQGR